MNDSILLRVLILIIAKDEKGGNPSSARMFVAKKDGSGSCGGLIGRGIAISNPLSPRYVRVRLQLSIVIEWPDVRNGEGLIIWKHGMWA